MKSIFAILKVHLAPLTVDHRWVTIQLHPQDIMDTTIPLILMAAIQTSTHHIHMISMDSTNTANTRHLTSNIAINTDIMMILEAAARVIHLEQDIDIFLHYI